MALWGYTEADRYSSAFGWKLTSVRVCRMIAIYE
jgi:hypothetical protein